MLRRHTVRLVLIVDLVLIAWAAVWRAWGTTLVPPPTGYPPGYVPATAAMLPGRYVGAVLALVSPTGKRLEMKVWSPDTLTFTADGAVRSSIAGSRVGTRYVIRGDSVYVSGGQRPHVYAAWRSPSRLMLYESASYDFDANGLPETATRHLIFERR